MKAMLCVVTAALVFSVLADIPRPTTDFDRRLDEVVAHARKDTNVYHNCRWKWIDGRDLPLEGKAFWDTASYYDRIPTNISGEVHGAVRVNGICPAGMVFRFTSNAGPFFRCRWRLRQWAPISVPNMTAYSTSGIDVYVRDPVIGNWLHKASGTVDPETKEGSLACFGGGRDVLVYLPLCAGIDSFELGVQDNEYMRVHELPHASGITKPVVFYGTSITQGIATSRPGLSYVNVIGRELDIPIVNLGFAAAGQTQMPMSEMCARVDASCYVLDCLYNMNSNLVATTYEPFIRNLRAKRPNVPIVMVEKPDVTMRAREPMNVVVRGIYERLKGERWQKLYYLSNAEMYSGSGEETVDGTHPNDLGQRTLAMCFGKALREVLGLR